MQNNLEKEPPMAVLLNVCHMKLESDGILIDLRPLNERDSLAHIFTRDYGVVVGMMRGGVVARKNKPMVGQVGSMVWNCRVDTQLGVFHWDATRNLVAPLMARRAPLSMMNAALGLVRGLLPERESYPTLYDETLTLLSALPAMSDSDAVTKYMGWEVCLLRDLGYALDLHSCAGCGRTDDLHYLSPRTCRAVCASCGAPYASRLYRLPLECGVLRQLLEHVCAAQGTSLPIARAMLSDKIA